MTIIQILESHSISIKECCGRLLAEEVYTLNGSVGSEWVDVTDWTITKIMYWLGY